MAVQGTRRRSKAAVLPRWLVPGVAVLTFLVVTLANSAATVHRIIAQANSLQDVGTVGELNRLTTNSATPVAQTQRSGDASLASHDSRTPVASSLATGEDASGNTVRPGELLEEAPLSVQLPTMAKGNLGSTSNVTTLLKSFKPSRKSVVTRKEEHYAVYSPLCVHSTGYASSTEVFTSHPADEEAAPACQVNGRVRPPEVCNSSLERAWNESGWSLTTPLVQQRREWFETNREDATKCRWVGGLTLLYRGRHSWQSVGYYAMRFLVAHHFLAYHDVFQEGPVNRVIFEVPSVLWPRMIQKSSFYRVLLRVIFAPLEEVLVEVDKFPDGIPPAIYLLKGGGLGLKLTCFDRVIVPGTFHGRYFIDQEEIETGLKKTTSFGVPDSSRLFAQRVYKYLGRDVPSLTRRMVYLKRTKKRRFDPENEARMREIFESAASKHSFAFSEVVLRDDSTFEDYADAVSNASVAIGLHGANMASVIFMPPGAHMIEIFPFQYHSTNYEAAATAGIRYSAFYPTQGTHGIMSSMKDYFGGVRACIKSSEKRKIFYRSDERPVTLSEVDTESLRVLLDTTLESVSSSFASGGHR